MILNNVLDNHETDLVLSRDNKPRGTKRQQSDGQAEQETTRSSNEKTKHNTHLHSLQRRQLCELTWIRKEESHSALLEARGVASSSRRRAGTSVDCRYRSCSNNQHISLVSEVEGQEGEHLKRPGYSKRAGLPLVCVSALTVHAQVSASRKQVHASATSRKQVTPRASGTSETQVDRKRTDWDDGEDSASRSCNNKRL